MRGVGRLWRVIVTIVVVGVILVLLIGALGLGVIGGGSGSSPVIESTPTATLP
jgi:hypothetical protein